MKVSTALEYINDLYTEPMHHTFFIGSSPFIRHEHQRHSYFTKVYFTVMTEYNTLVNTGPKVYGGDTRREPRFFNGKKIQYINCAAERDTIFSDSNIIVRHDINTFRRHALYCPTAKTAEKISITNMMRFKKNSESRGVVIASDDFVLSQHVVNMIKCLYVTYNELKIP